MRAGSQGAGKVSVHELRALSVAARQPDVVTVEHFLKRLRAALRFAAKRGDYTCSFTIPLIEGGLPLFDPADMAVKVGSALLLEDRRLKVTTSRNVIRVSWQA